LFFSYSCWRTCYDVGVDCAALVLALPLRLLLCFCALIRCAAFGTIDSLPRREIATGEKRQGNGIFRIWKARVRGAEKKRSRSSIINRVINSSAFCVNCFDFFSVKSIKLKWKFIELPSVCVCVKSCDNAYQLHMIECLSRALPLSLSLLILIYYEICLHKIRTISS